MDQGPQAYLRYAVVATLGIFAFSQIMISIVNPESFFWGTKLSGLVAQTYMMLQTLIAVFLIIVLLTKARRSAMLCVLFYGYIVTDIAWSNYYIHGFVAAGPLPLVGLVLSVLLWLSRWFDRA